MRGFQELLDNIQQNILSGEFREAFQKRKKASGSAARTLNQFPVTSDLASHILADLPASLFTEPYLTEDDVPYVVHGANLDDLDEEKVKRIKEIQTILIPHLDEIMFRISLTLLNPSRTQLNEVTQKALIDDFKNPQMIVALCSCILVTACQATLQAFYSQQGIEYTTHGAQTKLSEEQYEKINHITAILYIMQDYQKRLDRDELKIQEISPEPEVLIRLAKEYAAKGLYSEAVTCYKVACDKDPKALLHSVPELIQIGKIYAQNQDLSVEERSRISRDIGEILFSCTIETLKNIAVEEGYFPVSQKYAELPNMLQTIEDQMRTYQGDPSQKNFDTLLLSIQIAFEKFEPQSQGKKTMWEEKIKPAFKAMLTGCILIVLSALSVGLAPTYLMLHHKERKAVVDSFFNQDKNLKDRMNDFKSRFKEVKSLIEDAKIKKKVEEPPAPEVNDEHGPSCGA